jgi:hypothetical protein
MEEIKHFFPLNLYYLKSEFYDLDREILFKSDSALAGSICDKYRAHVDVGNT